MGILHTLADRWAGETAPFLIRGDEEITFADIQNANAIDISCVRAGDVVALIGDFEPVSIITMLRLIDLGVVLVALPTETAHQHYYFFTAACVDVVI